LKNAERSDRFKAEIEALKRIKHPNVMPIVDYSSDLDKIDKSARFFVMPKANGGNLAKRISLYKFNLDSTIDVSIQLAMALQATHALSIFHRDVKPANIMFKEVGHDLWLSDFGICHTLDSERITSTGDVMGPRGFIAPELESDSSSVTAACDIYSLGKVIYYMISGGVVISREVFDKDFNSLKDKGERYALLQILLSRMISPLSSRVSNADDVLKDLLKIKEWEKSAIKSTLNSSLLATINASQQRAIDQDRIQRENKYIEENLNEQIKSISSSVIGWINGHLEKIKVLMGTSGLYKLEITDTIWDRETYFGVAGYTEVAATQLLLENEQDIFKSITSIKFFVCHRARSSISTDNNRSLKSAQEAEFALIPYLQEYTGPNHVTLGLGGFLQDIIVIEASHRDLAQRTSQRYIQGNHPTIAKTFIGAPVNLILEFKASDWPGITQTMEELISKSVEIAIKFSMNSNRISGS